jgi:hypothetical protein
MTEETGNDVTCRFPGHCFLFMFITCSDSNVNRPQDRSFLFFSVAVNGDLSISAAVGAQ